MIEAYKKFWKGYVDFSGVTSRKDYWLAALANYIAAFLLGILGGMIGYAGSGAGPNVLPAIYFLASALPALAIMVRRLRDAGRSWENVFWMFLPVAGVIVLIVKLCRPAAAGAGFHAVPSEYTAGAPVYRTYQPQTKSPAVSTASAGAAPAAPKPACAPVQPAGNAKAPLSSLRPYHGNGVCDVCSRSLCGEKAYIVPNNIFYASPEYRQHYAQSSAAFFGLSRQSAEQALKHMQLQDHSEGSAVCETCIPMFADIPAPAKDENLPMHLLVRFDIQKLNTIGGAYGFSAGKLLGAAVPDALMERMIISDGDSKATLSGKEQVYLIDISASGSSPEILKDRIMPLIQQNRELMKYTAQPPAELCFDAAAEPLAVCGAVSNAQIAGAGGLCASGLTGAWREKKPRNNYCMNCGTELSENASFCCRCGTKVPDGW